jgi:hypothetical protein
MNMPRSPEETVHALVHVINGDVPRRTADDLLDPSVRIYMDKAKHKGRSLWYKWIHLIRGCGLIADLRMTDTVVSVDPLDPTLVHLTMRWEGRDRTNWIALTSPYIGSISYRVRDGIISEIWTRKSNYEFIFGEWVRLRLGYRLLLGWAILYFMHLSRHGKSYDSDAP